MLAPQKESYENLDNILKSKDITLLTKVRIVKAVFSSSHIQLWELDHKEGWVPKNWCFWTVVLEKTLESPLDYREIKPVNLKGNQPEYSLEWLMLKLQYFAHLMRRANSLEKNPDAKKNWRVRGKRRSGQQRMRWLDSITDLMDMNLSKLRYSKG